MTFAELLTEKRVAANLTQRELAKLLGVTHQAVSNWEQGRNYPGPQMLETIAKTFNIPEAGLIVLCERCEEMQEPEGPVREEVSPSAAEPEKKGKKRKAERAQGGADRAMSVLKTVVSIGAVCLGLLVCGLVVVTEACKLYFTPPDAHGEISMTVFNGHALSIVTLVVFAVVALLLTVFLIIIIIKTVKRKNQNRKP